MAPIATILPWVLAASTAASTATSIVAATRTPKAPVTDDKEQRRKDVLEAAYAQGEILRQRKSAASTILTGPQGVTQPQQGSKVTLG